MSQTYEVKDGKMPEEFHVKHLINNSTRIVEVLCAQCDEREQMSEEDLTSLENTTLEEYAAKSFYESGWRYCSLPEYEVEGIFCMGCIRDDGGIEDNTLQQPRETTHE